MGEPSTSSHQPATVSFQTPEERVFSNYMIVKQIFKRIRERDSRDDFRQTNSFCWRETLPTFRNSAKLVINGNPDFFDFYNNYIRWPEGLESLTKYPYRAVKLYSLDLPSLNRLTSTWDKFFWAVCAPHITYLELYMCSFSFHGGGALEFIKEVLLKLCPLLEELKINACREEEEPLDYDSAEENEDKNVEENEMEYKKIAENLKAICFGTDSFSKFHDMPFFRRVLRLTPNLKSLTLGGVIDPIEDYICFQLSKQKLKIEKFSILHHQERPFPACRAFFRYAGTHPQAIRELDFGLKFGVDANIADNLWLYNSIGECKSLEKLTLRCTLNEKAEAVPWYRDLDLEQVSLQSLTELRVKFKLDDNTKLLERTRFNFGMLKRTPKLENLSIKYNLAAGTPLERKPGLEDWVFKEGEEQNLGILWEPSDALQRLKFTGWGLNESDVEILSEKFPKLSFLGALFDNGTLPGLAAKLWKECLKTIEIYVTEAQYESDKFWEDIEAVEREYPKLTLNITRAYPRRRFRWDEYY